MAVVATAKSTASPPEVTLIGNAVALSFGAVAQPVSLEVEVQPTPVTLPDICMLLLDSPSPAMIVVFAFCEVEESMFQIGIKNHYVGSVTDYLTKKKFQTL